MHQDFLIVRIYPDVSLLLMTMEIFRRLADSKDESLREFIVMILYRFGSVLRLHEKSGLLN